MHRLAPLVLAALLAASCASGGDDPTPAPPEPSGPAAVVSLGFYPRHTANGGIENFKELERWLGRQLGYLVQFGDGLGETSFTNNLRGQLGADNLGRYDGSAPFRFVYSVPLAFGERHLGDARVGRAIEAQWDMLIDDTGGRRELYRQTAELLADRGFDDAVIRLGWEFDNPGSRWHARVNPEKFKQAWRIVHGLFRAVSPDFAFDFNFVRGAAGDPIVEEAYPGDAFVDVIGVDHYDSGYQGIGGVPAGLTAGYVDPQLAWDEGYLPDLQAHAAFALAKGKPVSFPEWGLSSGGETKVGMAGGDNPTFVRNTYAWLNQMAGPGGPGLLYAAYFQENSSPDGRHGIENFPQSERVFRELFGAP